MALDLGQRRKQTHIPTLTELYILMEEAGNTQDNKYVKETVCWGGKGKGRGENQAGRGVVKTLYWMEAEILVWWPGRAP